MGHYAFLIAASVIFGGAILSMGIRADTRVAETEVARIQFKEEARDAAIFGLNQTVRKVVLDTGPWSGASVYGIAETDYKNSTFLTTVTPVGADTLDIMSRGTKVYIDRLGESTDTTHTIDVRIIRTSSPVGGLPPAFKAALVTDEDLTITGTPTITSLDENQNATIHTNGELDAQGAFSVEGYGSYTTSEDVSNRFESNFEPNVDTNGNSSNVIFQDSIPIPPIDIDLLRSHVQSGQGVYFGGDADIQSSDVPYDGFADWASAVGATAGTGANSDQPFIVFAEGALNLQTLDLELDGWGLFVSNSSIHINGNSDIHGEIGTDAEGFPVAQLGIFVNGDIHLNGNADLTATIYTNGQWRANGTADVTGGVIVRDIGTVNGTFNLVWAGANEGIAQYFGGGTTEVLGPVIAARADW